MRDSEEMAPKPYLALIDLVYNMNYEVKRFFKYKGQQTAVNALYLVFLKKGKKNKKRNWISTLVQTRFKWLSYACWQMNFNENFKTTYAKVCSYFRTIYLCYWGLTLKRQQHSLN